MNRLTRMEMSRVSHHWFARTSRLGLIATLFACLSGCSLIIPKEIKQMLAETSAGAAALKAERPDAFRTYEAGDRTMHYVEVADDTPKPLILFIHGSPGSWKDFVRYLNDPELRAKAHMISVDRPGFGSGPVEPSMTRQCENIAPLLDKAAPGQRVVVLGYSYGGPMAVRLAIDHPDKVTDVFILAGSVDPDLEHTKWYQYVAEWPLVNRAVPTELAVANTEIRALKADLVEMLPIWKSVTQRVTIVQGDADDLVPPANADFAERMLTAASSVNIIRLPGANHFTPWNRYDAIKSALQAHLE